MQKKIAIYGQTGQLARALKRQVKAQNLNATFCGRSDCDLSSNPELIHQFSENYLKDAHVAIIAAAYTAVDRAETDVDNAHAVNAVSSAIIAQICKNKNIPLVYVSTDYVFDGTHSSPYTPASPTRPMNVYGKTKLTGEKNIIETRCNAAILRTSWVFDGNGKNFLTTMLHLAKTHENLKIVADQIGRPTYAGYLAEACLVAANKLCEGAPNSKGVFHVSGTGEAVSWADFAKEIFSLGSDLLPHIVNVTKIPSSEYPTLAYRPAYSLLDVSKFEQVFNHTLPHWRDGLKAAYKEWQQE